MTEAEKPPEEARPKSRWPHDRVNHLAHLLRASSPGDLSELRRLDVSSPSSPAFWKLVLTQPTPPEQERAWAVILSGMASSEGLHQPGRRAGAAMAEVVSEARFTRLLRASGERLGDELRRVVHQLASAAVPFDWGDLAELILSDGGERGDATRRRIARDYYGALARAEADSQASQE